MSISRLFFLFHCPTTATRVCKCKKNVCIVPLQYFVRKHAVDGRIEACPESVQNKIGRYDGMLAAAESLQSKSGRFLRVFKVLGVSKSCNDK